MLEVSKRESSPSFILVKMLSMWEFSVCVCAELLQSCATLGNSMDYSPPGSYVHRILQARILEWIAMCSSRASSWPRYQTLISCLLHWQLDSLTLVPPGKPLLLASKHKSKKSHDLFLDWPYNLSPLNVKWSIISNYTGTVDIKTALAV